MNLSNELTTQVNAHLSEVRKYLGNLPADERQEILQSIESHIYDALQSRNNGEPTLALLEAVLAEMDPPESYGELPLAPRKTLSRLGLVLILSGVALAILFVMRHNKGAPADNSLMPQVNHSEIFLKPVEHPSTPQPPSGKYAFQIIKVEAPAEIVQSPQTDVEKIIQHPDVKICEYPTLIAGLGESVTNEQIEALSMDVDWGLIDGKAVTKEKMFELGDSISVTVNGIKNGAISYHLNVYHLELAGFFEHKIKNGFLEKTQPRFKKEAVDTDLTQRFNSWLMLQGIIEPQPDGKKINRITCIRVISSDTTQDDHQPELIGRWVSVDLVDAIEQFNPQSQTWTNGLYLETLSFLPEGRTDKPWWIWKDGKLHHIEIGIDATYSIKEISGEEYLFLEWFQNARDYTRIKYYVLKRSAPMDVQNSWPQPVAFEQGLNTFENGDAIILDEVLCSSPRFVIGDTVIIKGQYTLSSRSNARLSLTTSATQGNGRSVVTEKQQSTLTKGKGEFELSFTIKNHGCSHLQMYDNTTGKSIGGLNFGSKQQVEEMEARGQKKRLAEGQPTVKPQSADPVGHWVSVDFVSTPEQFDPQVRTWAGDLYLKELTFLPEGKTDRLYWTWKDGVLHHSGDNTAAKFFIKQIDGEDYLFMEWMSGDVTLREQPPKYYVLKKGTLEKAKNPQLSPVAFEQGCNTLKEGDSIVLEEVLSTSPLFVEGDVVTAKGRYTLSSQPSARLALFVTGTRNRGRSTVTKEQRVTVTQGTGEFMLTATIPYHGCPHLTFYDETKGTPLGGIYFGTKGLVEEIRGSREKKSPAENTDTQKGTTMKQSLALAAASILAATNLLAGEAQTEFRLQEAIDSASPGDTVIIPAGTYTQPVIIRKKITLDGQDAIFKVAANQPAIQIDTSKPVFLKNLEIQYQLKSKPQKGEFPYAVYTSGGDLLIENCAFKGAANPDESPCAVLATAGSSLHIKNSRFDGFNYTIQIADKSNGDIEACLIMNPGHCGITIGDDSSATLKHNIVSGSRYHGIRCTGGEIIADSNLIIANKNRGFYIGNKSAIGTLSNNLIIDNATGINVFANSKLTIANNVILRSSYAGLSLSDTATLDIENNVIMNNERGVTGFSEGKGKEPLIKVTGKNLIYGNSVECEKAALPSRTIKIDPLFKDADSGLFTVTANDAKDAGLTNPSELQTLWNRWAKQQTEK